MLEDTEIDKIEESQDEDIRAQAKLDRRRETAILLLGTVWVGRYCRSTIHLF